MDFQFKLPILCPSSKSGKKKNNEKPHGSTEPPRLKSVHHEIKLSCLKPLTAADHRTLTNLLCLHDDQIDSNSDSNPNVESGDRPRRFYPIGWHLFKLQQIWMLQGTPCISGHLIPYPNGSINTHTPLLSDPNHATPSPTIEKLQLP